MTNIGTTETCLKINFDLYKKNCFQFFISKLSTMYLYWTTDNAVVSEFLVTEF